MTEAVARSRGPTGGWVAVVVANGALGVVGAVAVALWWATACGLVSRAVGTGNEKPISLVTDADGRLRYRLADGEYQVSLVGGEQVRFSVHDQRWTTVRMHLP